MTGHVQFLSLLDLAHGAKNFVVLRLNLLIVSLSVRVLILCVNGCLKCLSFRVVAFG